MVRLALLLVALLAPALPGCGGEPEPTHEARTDAGPAELETPVHRIELGNVDVSVTASGTIAARRVTEIAPEVQGRLVEISVDVGDEVAAGDPLFRIDRAPFEMAAADASAGLALARAEAAHADAEAQRIDRLASENAASAQRVDQLRTQAAVAKARVEQAEARVARAERDLLLTVVRAPYDGHIVERRADEGGMAGAAPVLVLQEGGDLEAVLDVPEAAAPVRTGDAVRLRVEGITRPVATRIEAVSRRVDPDTRTYEARATVPNERGLVKAGSYTQATIDTSRGDPAPIVPRPALLMRDGRTFVFRVEDDRVARVPVTLGRTGPDSAEVASGLEVGDEVAVGDVIGRLGDGSRIRPARSAAPLAGTPPSESGG